MKKKRSVCGSSSCPRLRGRRCRHCEEVQWYLCYAWCLRQARRNERPKVDIYDLKSVPLDIGESFADIETGELTFVRPSVQVAKKDPTWYWWEIAIRVVVVGIIVLCLLAICC